MHTETRRRGQGKMEAEDGVTWPPVEGPPRTGRGGGSTARQHLDVGLRALEPRENKPVAASHPVCGGGLRWPRDTGVATRRKGGAPQTPLSKEDLRRLFRHRQGCCPVGLAGALRRPEGALAPTTATQGPGRRHFAACLAQTTLGLGRRQQGSGPATAYVGRSPGALRPPRPPHLSPRGRGGSSLSLPGLQW